jgi:hypothetical protein
VHAVAVN